MTQPTSNLRISTLFTYSSHTALITGGATGLGAIPAQALVQNDGSVILASRKEPQFHATSTRLNALWMLGREWETFSCEFFFTFLFCSILFSSIIRGEGGGWFSFCVVVLPGI